MTATRLLRPTIRVRLRLLDDDREVAGRVHIRAEDGRQLTLDDHTRLVSARWFEDRGTAVKVGGWSYAYVDGVADVLVPPGRI